VVCGSSVTRGGSRTRGVELRGWSGYSRTGAGHQ
jgi:hypothetical protein